MGTHGSGRVARRTRLVAVAVLLAAGACGKASVTGTAGAEPRGPTEDSLPMETGTTAETTTTEATAAPTTLATTTTSPRVPTSTTSTAEPEPEETGCHPSYEGACLPAGASDIDCEGGSGDGPEYSGPVRVVGPDEYELDRDGNGLGCERS